MKHGLNTDLKFVFPLSFMLLVAGCSTDKDQIAFSDESTAQQSVTSAVVGLLPQKPQQKKLETADELKVRETVFGYLLSRHFWDDGNYSAIFLQGDDDEVDALIKKFPNHVPPVKPSYLADLPPNRAPIDKDTGKLAMILTVDVGEPNADDSVDALGKWYAGGAVTGFYSFVLKKSGDDWTIESVK
jgi:hypothetical protein